MKKKLKSDSPLRAATCSPSSDTPETDTLRQKLWGKGWPDSYMTMMSHANQLERERDEARRLHAYANEQRKAADNGRMNTEEAVARLRARVDELLKHGKDACEYTDGWDDALLKVRDEFPPENAGGMAPGSAVQKPELENELGR